jgi:hypothetical protein
MSQMAISSTRRIKIHRGALRRAAWKATSLLVVLAMLLPNFTVLVQEVQAADNQNLLALEGQIKIEKLHSIVVPERYWNFSTRQKTEQNSTDKSEKDDGNTITSVAIEPSTIPTDTVKLHLSADPTFVSPGTQILFTWEIDGWNTISDSTDQRLLFSVPPGFTPLDIKTGDFIN